VGRLELFAQSALRNAWQAIPAPQVVLYDLRQAFDNTDAARDTVLALLTNSEPVKTALSLEGLAQEQMKRFASAPPVYHWKTEALAALREAAGGRCYAGKSRLMIPH
jgi:hypothetical protein